MRLLRLFFTIGVILFVFVGNIGINVFIHSCKEDGIMQSYFLKSEEHCTGISCNEENKTVKLCCNKIKKKEGCCSDEIKTYHVRFDYFEAQDTIFPILPFLPEVFHYSEKFRCDGIENTFSRSTKPPPDKPPGKQLLIQYQIFLI
jgi:hypothetical protein